MTRQQLLDEYISNVLSLPDEAQRQVTDFVAFLRQRYPAVPSSSQPGSTDLEHEAFIGMWRNRQDFADSTSWVRDIRKSEWGGGE